MNIDSKRLRLEAHEVFAQHISGTKFLGRLWADCAGSRNSLVPPNRLEENGAVCRFQPPKERKCRV